MPGIDHTTYILSMVSIWEDGHPRQCIPIFKRIVGKDKLWKSQAVAGYPYGKYLAGNK